MATKKISWMSRVWVRVRVRVKVMITLLVALQHKQNIMDV